MFPNIKGLKQIFSIEHIVEKFEVLEGKGDNEKPDLDLLGAIKCNTGDLREAQSGRIVIPLSSIVPDAQRGKAMFAKAPLLLEPHKVG